LAARSYGAIDNPEKAKEYLVKAKEEGWTNWDPIVQSEELQSVISTSEWDEILN
jgi:hypothetical protein